MNIRRKQIYTTILLITLPLLVLVIALFVGRYPKPIWMNPALLGSDEIAQRLVLNLRLPRTITAMLLGMSLAAAGGVMQMLFRNPLVEPGFLGVSQGAGFGASLCIVFLTTNPLAIEGVATLFAVLGLAFSYFFARKMRYGGWLLRLVLAGIAVSAFFSAGLGILKYLADPNSQLQQIVFWLLGGLYSITWKSLLYILPVVIVGIIIIYLMRWRLNLLALEDETAFSLGVSVGRERTLLLAASVAVTAVVISVAGIVAWIGLIIPHIARRITGANAANFIPVSISLGAIFGILCDSLARTLMPGEIPLGIITSLLGAAIFIFLMVKPNLKVKA